MFLLAFRHRDRVRWTLALALCISQIVAAASPAVTASQANSRLQDSVSAWGLPELAQQMIANNPQLLSARQFARAGRLGVLPAGAPDNPSLTLNQDPLRNSPLAWNTSQGASWTFSQNVYWPGKKSLASQVVAAQASATESQVFGLQSQLLAQLRTAWLGWQTSQAQLQLTRQQLLRLEQIKEITRLRYTQNAAAFADYINAQVMQEQMRTTLLTIQLQADTQMAQIAALLGSPAPGHLQLRVEEIKSDQAIPDLELFQQETIRRNPQLKASAALVQAAERSVELAELNRRPDFNVALTGHAANPPWGLANNPTYGVAVGMTFPLWYAQKEKPLLEQARAQLASTREADESLRQQTLLAVNTAWLQWSQNIEQLRLMEGAMLEQSRLAYRLALSNYSAGQAPYIDVLNAFNTERNAESAVFQARSNALIARVALDAAVGETELQTAP